MEREPRQQEENLPEQELSPLQVKAEAQVEKIEEVREATEIVKANLAGLKYKPLASEENEKYYSMCQSLIGVPEEKFLEVFANASLYEIFAKKGADLGRIKQLVEREKSIRYLLKHQVDGFKKEDNITKEDLADSRFFTIRDLIERADEKINLNSRAKEDIKNPSGNQEALQKLVDEYILRAPDLFDIDQETGRVIVKALDEDKLEEVQGKFNEAIQWQQWYRQQISSVLESSRTGIDPGVLIISDDRRQISYQVKNVGGRLDPPSRFVGELGKTGLILVPVFLYPDVLKHEYAHFEDWVFEGGSRKKLDSLITEVNSFLKDHEDVLEVSAESVFENIKGILLGYYLKEAKPSSMSLKEAKEKVTHLVDAVRRLYKNGFSREAISSILLQSDKFEDVLA